MNQRTEVTERKSAPGGFRRAAATIEAGGAASRGCGCQNGHGRDRRAPHDDRAPPGARRATRTGSGRTEAGRDEAGGTSSGDAAGREPPGRGTTGHGPRRAAGNQGRHDLA